MFRSNGSHKIDDMSNITDWVDEDSGTGDSSQVTFDGKSCMKLDSGGSAGGAALRSVDIGTFGARTVVSFGMYLDSIGTYAQSDFMQVAMWNGSQVCTMLFCSNGYWVYGSGWNQIGSATPTQDVWSEWTVDQNWTTKRVNVYLNQAPLLTNVDTTFANADRNGEFLFRQYGVTSASRIGYIDWIRMGTGIIAPQIISF